MHEGGNQLGLSSNKTGSFQMSKTSQKEEKEDGLHAMAHRLRKLGASQQQRSTAGGNQWQGTAASWGKCVLGFPGLVVSSLLRSSPVAEPGHGMGLGLAGTSQPKSLQLWGKCTLTLAGSGPSPGHAWRPSNGEQFGVSPHTALWDHPRCCTKWCEGSSLQSI